MKRFHLIIKDEAWDRLSALAEQDGSTVVSQIRRAVKLWFMVRSGEVKLVRNGSDMEVL